MRIPLRAVFFAFLLAAHATVFAHSRGTSYSEWVIGNGDAEVRGRVSQLELTRLQLSPEWTADYAARAGELMAERIELWSEAGRCTASPVSSRATQDGWVVANWHASCPSWKNLTIRSRLIVDIAPSHLHFVRVQLADGEIRERVLTASAPSMALEEPVVTASSSVYRYVRLGIAHILSGWDHMAFVLALILLAASLREVAVLATGFTVAHSITLAAAVLGWAQTRASIVEALIGFSIALVAAENLWLRGGRERWLPQVLVASLLALAISGVTRLPLVVLLGLALFTFCHFALLRDSDRPARLRIALAFIFGLVHGFGFAGVMAELRLPADKLAPALLGFNTGVELGQLLVIASVWPMLRWLGRRPVSRIWTHDVGSAAICALGVYWFVIRSVA